MTTQEITLAAINVLAWLVIHMGFAWLGTRAPIACFKPRAWLFRTYAFERSGRFYESVFRVKTWKDKLPDGAAWFKSGFPKKKLAQADPVYMNRFIVETCRGELVHWIVCLASGLFFLWNEAWVGWLMVVYGIVANFPCIIIQRYNRGRLRRIALKRTPREVRHEHI